MDSRPVGRVDFCMYEPAIQFFLCGLLLEFSSQLRKEKTCIPGIVFSGVDFVM
jgi:hypothetical protein